jgi:hypothetical protein
MLNASRSGGLVNYDRFTWWKANKTNRAVVFSKRARHHTVTNFSADLVSRWHYFKYVLTCRLCLLKGAANRQRIGTARP